MKSIWKRFKTSKSIRSLRSVFAVIICSCALHAAVADNLIEEAIHIQKSSENVPQIAGDTYIDQTSYKRFSSLLPSEIAPLFEDDTFQVKVSNVIFPPLPVTSNFLEPAIDSKGDIVGSDAPKSGFLFPLTSENEANYSSARGYQILWNIQAAQWARPVLNYEFSIRYNEGSKTTASAQGTLLRLYPALVDPKFSKEQLFREKVTLTNPPSIAPYSWLTFRMIGSGEDLVWLYSPIVKKERQIVSSLRDESIFFSELSANDLFTFSGKPQWYNPRIVGYGDYYAPLSINTTISDSSGQDCFITSANNSDVTFFKRQMWKLELTSKDPYSKVGKVILYVDAESSLPLYKFTYSKDRKLEHVVYSQFELIPAPSHEFPYELVYRKTASFNPSTRRNALLSITSGSGCMNASDSISLKSFDPSLLAGK